MTTMGPSRGKIKAHLQFKIMQTIKNIKDSYESQHIPELDGIRGIAILSVLVYHLFWFTSPGGHWTGLPHLFWKVAQVGWVGVNLFFVLSGFLITRILINQKKKPNYFGRFYKRRVLRILPLYLVTLLFIYFHYEHSGPFVFLSLGFLAHIPSVFGITPCYPGLWSLSVEEQFYLVWPQFIKRFSLHQVKVGAVVICVVSAVLRGLALKFSSWSILLGVLGGFDGFAYGAILAIRYLETEGNKKKLKSYSIACLVLILIAIIAGYPFGIVTRQKLVGEMFLPSLIYLAASALMAYSLAQTGSRRLKYLSSGFLPEWGKLSYAAYLCHYPIPEITNKLFSLYPDIYAHYFEFWFSVVQFLLSLGGTYIVSLALYKWIEQPFLKLKDRSLFFSQSGYPQKATEVP